MNPGFDSVVFLVGPRGSGKTTVGRILAKRLGASFVDTDEMVEAEAGATIESIFATGGEGSFRRLEAAAVARAAAMKGTVAALGGGAVEARDSLDMIRRSGVVVRLSARPVTLYRRVTADPRSAASRPPLTGLDPMQEIEVTAARRESAWIAAAHFTIETDFMTPEQAADGIVRMLGCRISK